jgi:hypothetical protein
MTGLLYTASSSDPAAKHLSRLLSAQSEKLIYESAPFLQGFANHHIDSKLPVLLNVLTLSPLQSASPPSCLSLANSSPQTSDVPSCSNATRYIARSPSTYPTHHGVAEQP